MSNSKPQRLVIHTHDGKKLFHVSMHNIDTTTGWTWNVVASKSRSAYKNVLEGKPADLTRELNGGLAIAMVNTNYEGWQTTEYPGQFSVADAVGYKEDLIEQYEEAGYTNVGVRTFTNKGNPNNVGNGANWSKAFNINSMSKAKIYEKIEFINTSLQLNIPVSIKNSAYLETVRANSNSIYNLGSLLKYVRNEMGLE